MKSLMSPENLQFLFREKNNNGAEFTAKSLATQKDYTFKISRSLYNNIWYTHVYVEQGYLQFKRLGIYFQGKIKNKNEVINTPAAIAISWILRKVENKLFKDLNNVEIMHTGHCLVCGKKLTDAQSIEHGIGPVCRG